MPQEPSEEHKYDGMTVNERLFTANLLDAFDEAIRLANRERMIELLVKVEFSREAATRTTNSILSHPTRFGRM